MLASAATSAGLSNYNVTVQNGNGLVQNYGQISNPIYGDASGETTLFWAQVHDAGLLETPTPCTTCTIGAGALQGFGHTDTSAQISALLPTIKLRNNAYVAVFSAGTEHFYQMMSVSSPNVGWAFWGHYGVLFPGEAENIDTKIDDGVPTTGTVRAMDNTRPNPSILSGSSVALGVAAQTGAANSNFCVLTGGTAYNLSGTAGSLTSCELRFKASF